MRGEREGMREGGSKESRGKKRMIEEAWRKEIKQEIKKGRDAGKRGREEGSGRGEEGREEEREAETRESWIRLTHYYGKKVT